jgi:hypothetical protein
LKQSRHDGAKKLGCALTHEHQRRRFFQDSNIQTSSDSLAQPFALRLPAFELISQTLAIGIGFAVQARNGLPRPPFQEVPNDSPQNGRAPIAPNLPVSVQVG